MRKEKKEIFSEELAEKVIEEVFEKKERAEEKEVLTEEEKIIREKLIREIQLMRLSPQLDEEAQKEAQRIKALDAEGKLKKLLVLAGQKGISFAVKVAEKLHDAYLLDIFHDILAREGFFKKFKK